MAATFKGASKRQDGRSRTQSTPGPAQEETCKINRDRGSPCQAAYRVAERADSLAKRVRQQLPAALPAEVDWAALMTE